VITHDVLTDLASLRGEQIAVRARHARPTEIPAATTRRTGKRTSRRSRPYRQWRRVTASPELH
jgi:hypothetical protein